jgi:hypothetical protein
LRVASHFKTFTAARIMKRRESGLALDKRGRATEFWLPSARLVPRAKIEKELATRYA